MLISQVYRAIKSRGLTVGLCDTLSLYSVVFAHPLRGAVCQTTLLPPSLGINAQLVASNQSSVCAAAVQGVTVHCTVTTMWAAYLLAALPRYYATLLPPGKGAAKCCAAPAPLRGPLPPKKGNIIPQSRQKKQGSSQAQMRPCFFVAPAVPRSFSVPPAALNPHSAPFF